jgi:hypothetical protein
MANGQGDYRIRRDKYVLAPHAALTIGTYLALVITVSKRHTLQCSKDWGQFKKTRR